MIDRGWKFYPALKLLVPYAAGIILAKLAAPDVGYLLLALAVVFMWFGVASRSQRLWTGLPLLGSLFICGALNGVLHLRTSFDGLEGLSVPRADLIGRVVSTPIIQPDRIDFVVEPDSLLVRNTAAYPESEVLVRIYDTTIAPRQIPQRGDHISLIGAIAVPGPAVNPGGFDYGAYLRSRGIGLTMSVYRAGSIDIFQRGDLAWWERAVETVRQGVRDFADTYVGGEEGDIVRALLIGEREYISQTTRESFMRTGTVHILAVSGLHVGVIALALFVIVSWIPERVTQLLVYVSVLACYAVVAGGSPSIIRAVIMASAIMLARTTGRIQRPLNTIAVAALFILTISPDALFDIGFQLSFASVAGIILIVGPVSQAIRERWEWAVKYDPVWRILQLFLLSAGVQLCTLPVVLYHFGYVSVAAPLINIVVVPVAAIALGASALGVITLVFPLLSGWFGGAAYVALMAVEWLVQRATTLNAPIIQPGTIGVIAALVIAGMTLYLAMSRSVRQSASRFVLWCCAFGCVLMVDHLADPLRPRGARDIYLLRSRNGLVLAAVEHDTLQLFASGMDAADTTLTRYVAEPLGRRLGITGRRIINLDSAETCARSELVLINDMAQEYAMRSLPIIVAPAQQRPPGFVRFGSETMLYAPLRARLDRCALMRYDGRWREVEWR